MTEWVCSSCGEQVPDEPRVPCVCGSESRTTELTFQTQVRALPMMKAKAFDRKLTGGKNYFAEVIVGWDLRKSLGDFVSKVRQWNKRDDTYVESVKTADGTVIHECKEPLSEHRSHGSDKPRK